MINKQSNLIIKAKEQQVKIEYLGLLCRHYMATVKKQQVVNMCNTIKLQKKIERSELTAITRTNFMQNRLWPKSQEFAQEERLDKRSR